MAIPCNSMGLEDVRRPLDSTCTKHYDYRVQDLDLGCGVAGGRDDGHGLSCNAEWPNGPMP